MQQHALKCLAVGLWLVLSALTASAQDMIGNTIVTLTADEDPTYGYKLVSLTASGQTIDFAPADLWDVVLRDGTTGDWYHVHASGAETPFGNGTTSYTLSKVVTADSITIAWRNVTVTPPGMSALTAEKFAISLSFSANTGDDFISVTAKVSRAQGTPTLSVFRVEQRIPFASYGPAEEQVLAAPIDHGVLYPDPMNATRIAIDPGYNGMPGEDLVLTAPGGGISMQWFAYYNKSTSYPGCIYYGTRDTQNYIKVYEVYPETTAGYLTFATQHYLEDALVPQSSFNVTVPYPVVFTALDGDWYDAARYYRAWAIQQPWAANGAIKASTTFSSTIRNADMIGSANISPCASEPSCSSCSTCTISGKACSGVPDYSSWNNWDTEISEIKAYMQVDSIVFKPWFWDDDSFDSCWGDWFPIIPQWQAAASTVGLQNPIAPYANILTYCQQSLAFSSPGSSYVPGYTSHPVSDFAVRTPDGSIYGDLASCRTRRGGSIPCATACNEVLSGASMCMGTDFANAYARYLADVLTDEGARGLYLDVQHGQNFLCFAAQDPFLVSEHPHSVGGGKYWAGGEVALMQAVKADMRLGKGIEDFFLWTEGPSEHYLGEVELTYSNTGSDNGFTAFRAPLFETVYGDYYMMGAATAVSGQFLAGKPAGFFTSARQVLAAQAYLGIEVAGGTVLSSDCGMPNCDTFDDYRAVNQGYADAVEMLQFLLAVTKNVSARAQFRFGERLRDPVITSGSFVDYTGALGAMKVYDDIEPTVYVSAWGEYGSSIGVLLLNWTDDGDSLPGGVPGGSKTIQVALNFEEDYGLAPGLLDARVVTHLGESGSIQIDYTAGGVFSQQFIVPERTTYMWIVEPHGP